MKPRFESVAFETGLQWRPGEGWLYQEKNDGRWAEVDIAGARIIGERMRDGRLVAFDCVRADGQDIAREPLRVRWAELGRIMRTPTPGFNGAKIELVKTGNAGEFLEMVVSRGGEGVVAKRLDQPFGATWLKCKRSQVYYCRVAELDAARGCAVVVDRESGEARGRVGLSREQFYAVTVGAVLKIEAYGLTARGLLREPRLDRDAPESWKVESGKLKTEI